MFILRNAALSNILHSKLLAIFYFAKQQNANYLFAQDRNIPMRFTLRGFNYTNARFLVCDGKSFTLST